MEDERCGTNIGSWRHQNLKQANGSLRTILDQMDGFLSKWSNGTGNGFTTSPAPNLTVNINIIAPTAGGGGEGHITINMPKK